MGYKWTEITREDVIQAIDRFLAYEEEYPKARNTFLIWQDKKLPAKHIRFMAYKEHFAGSDITKEDLQGGEQTVRFFNRLGFEVKYKGEYFKPASDLK